MITIPYVDINYADFCSEASSYPWVDWPKPGLCQRYLDLVSTQSSSLILPDIDSIHETVNAFSAANYMCLSITNIMDDSYSPTVEVDRSKYTDKHRRNACLVAANTAVRAK